MLYSTDVGDEGLANLRDPTTLTYLDLAFCKNVTDDGLSYLAALKNLEELYVNCTAITDDGTKHLTKMGSLKKLYVGSTQISDEGAKVLRKSLPGCAVER